jgi:type III pantothenate kinase
MYGVPAVVIDFGTALSFDAISADGAYIGTAIAPGLQMAANALSARTARLQDVTLISPPHAIGRNTEASMQSGLVFGYAGLVEGMVGRFQRALGGAARIVSTGDDAELILRHTTVPHHFDPDLTLHGLRLIHEQNA